MLEVAELEANGMQVAVLRPELETASILHSCAVTLVYVGWGWGLSVPDSTCCHDARLLRRCCRVLGVQDSECLHSDSASDCMLQVLHSRLCDM